MSFGAPSPPDPTATSNTQQQYNIQAAAAQNKQNSYNQTNPFGSIQYTADPNSPSGYSVNTSLNPNSTALLNTQQGTAANLANNSAGMYSQPYDLNAASAATAKNLNSWQQQYVQPIFDQQSSNLEAQLRNQGLTPGSQAYDNAKNLLARNQGDVTNQYLTQNQGQAYQQALQSYETPLQTLSGIEQTVPGAPQFAQTPTSQIQPANYQGAAQNAYQGQLSNYENTWNNIAKLGVAAAGVAGAPFTGGLSLAGAGALGGMFGGSPGPITYGGPNGPTAFYGNNTSGGWG